MPNKKNKRPSQDPEITKEYMKGLSLGRKMTSKEIRIAHEFIELLPMDAEVTVCFFFGAEKWNALSVQDRRALGYDFRVQVKRGLIVGVKIVSRPGINRYYRA
jgi:hypothetical protein